MRFKKAELDIRTRYISDLEKRLTTYFKDYRNEWLCHSTLPA